MATVIVVRVVGYFYEGAAGSDKMASVPIGTEAKTF